MLYQFTYLIFSSIFFSMWLFVFLLRRDVRKEMLVVSFLFGLAGPFADFLSTQDYWKPPTLTNTSVGIESFLIGFFIGGVASVVYEEIFKLRLSGGDNQKMNIRFLQSAFLLGCLVFLSFYLLDQNSFHSFAVGLLTTIIIMLIKRKDLILDSLVTGFIMVVIGIGVYLLLNVLQPGFIRAIWILDGAWYTKLILGIPFGEFIFYFLVGMFIGPFYEYWRGAKLVKKVY